MGGEGHDEVRRFDAEQLIGKVFPPDAELVPISRTIDGERLVDEVVINFTHTQAIEHFLPGVAPTGRRATVAVAVIVGLQHGTGQLRTHRLGSGRTARAVGPFGWS